MHVFHQIIADISNNEIFDSVEIERTILKSYGGGCHQKIGVSHEILETGKLLTVKGETENGEDLSERSFNNKKKWDDYIKKQLKDWEEFYIWQPEHYRLS